MTRPMWKHQQICVERARGKDCFALLFEMGAGKTRTCIEIIRERFKENGRMMRTLILAPSVVTWNWKRELAMFAPEIPQNQVLVLHGTGIQRLKQLQSTPSYFVVVANYESLLMEPVFSQLKSWKPDICVGDESQKFKNHRAQRTKRAIAVSALSKYRYILSGTPITKDQKDLFSQFLFLDHGRTFGKNYFDFLHLYFTDANAIARKKNPGVKWHNWMPKKNREQQFNEKVMSQAMSVRKEDCLDLPPYITQKLEVDMSPEQAKAYKTMKEDYISFIGSKAFTAQVAVSKALRLQQIASGFIMDDERTHTFENTPKEKALLELLEEITTEHKVVVWACWRSNHATIGKLLDKHSYNWRGIFGDTSVADREVAMQAFREDPNVRVLVGSQAALGIGVNLVEASHSIFFSRNFSLEQDLQAEARTYRGGSEIHSSCYRFDLITRGTLDEQVTESLLKKQQIADSVMKGELKV